MEFTLTYRGPLPGGNAARRVEYKQRIREAVHRQLADLWGRDPRLKPLKPAEFAIAEKSARFVYDVKRPIQGTQNIYYRVVLGETSFVPLVTRLRYMECQLDISWHRQDAPGSILDPTGDIDNRLKTLFDALRIPQSADELPPQMTHSGVFYCLLEDDALITGVSVNTSQILGTEVVEQNYVELSLAVRVRPRSPMMVNLEMLFP